MEDKIKRLQKLLMDGQLEPRDFKDMRSQCENEKQRLQLQMDQNSTTDEDVKQLLKTCSQKAVNMAELYARAAPEQKRSLLGSTFPEKISFDGINCRTQRMNEVLNLMLLADNGLRKIKTGQPIKNLVLSLWVEQGGIDSNLLREDLELFEK